MAPIRVLVHISRGEQRAAHRPRSARGAPRSSRRALSLQIVAWHVFPIVRRWEDQSIRIAMGREPGTQRFVGRIVGCQAPVRRSQVSTRKARHTGVPDMTLCRIDKPALRCVQHNVPAGLPREANVCQVRSFAVTVHNYGTADLAPVGTYRIKRPPKLFLTQGSWNTRFVS